MQVEDVRFMFMLPLQQTGFFRSVFMRPARAGSKTLA